jgi:glycosyltransferase involved in cell wall biosynthesis
MRTIIIKLSGGIGNQVFQYLFGMAQFKRHDAELLFDVTDCLLDHSRGFSLQNLGISGNFFRCEKKIVDFGGHSYIELTHPHWISKTSATTNAVITAKWIQESSITYDPSIIEHGHHAYYDGYWQSYRYWDHNLVAIDQFTAQISSSPLSLETQKSLEELRINPEICAIHVRRGDYLTLQDYHGHCDDQYFIKAALSLKLRQFHLYTDDQEHATVLIEQFTRLGLELVNASEKIGSENKEFYCLTHYSHFIISNSSFSYLASFIAKARHSVLSVIAPYPWYSFQIKGPDFSENWIALNRRTGNNQEEDRLQTQAASISVIIPLHSRVEFIASAVETALHQSHQPCEVILCLNDPTIEVENEANRLAREYALVKVVQIQKKSLSAARNAGILSAKGEYLAFLDDDDLWEKRKLQVQLQHLILYGADVVACNFYEFDHTGKQLNQSSYPTQKIAAWKELLISENLFSGGSAALVKKSVFDQVGYFDESLPACEDHDMWRRIAYHQLILYFLEDVLVGVRKNPLSMSGNKLLMLRGELLHFEKILRDPLSSEQLTKLVNKIHNLQSEIQAINARQAEINTNEDDANSAMNIDQIALEYPPSQLPLSKHHYFALERRRLWFRIYHYEHLSIFKQKCLVIYRYFANILSLTVRYILIIFLLLPIELGFYIYKKAISSSSRKD